VGETREKAGTGLETDPDANPTLATITRYAEALGKDLQILLADKAFTSERRSQCVPRSSESPRRAIKRGLTRPRVCRFDS
jgi:hypothetical protein